MVSTERKTFFIDIDGTILVHLEDFDKVCFTKEIPALPDAREKLVKWHCDGHMIVLTTGRAESLRSMTELQLHNAGIIYDMLIMGIGSGRRVLINDYVDPANMKAASYNVKRNTDGLVWVEE